MSSIHSLAPSPVPPGRARAPCRGSAPGPRPALAGASALLVLAAGTLGAAGIPASDAGPAAVAALVQAACPLVEPSAGHNASDVAEGRMARAFFYRVLIIQARDRCIGQDHVMAALSELLRSARMRDAGLVDEKAYLDKEREVTGLLRAEDERRRQGGAAHDDANLMQRYAAEIQERLFKLPVPRQFSMCTYFGDRPVCEQ